MRPGRFSRVKRNHCQRRAASRPTSAPWVCRSSKQPKPCCCPADTLRGRPEFRNVPVCTKTNIPRDTTQYGYPEDEPDLTEEIRSLDWVNEPNPSVQEAAELIYEIWSCSRGDDERSIHELLAEVPVEFRDDVSAIILEHYLSAAEPSATENLDDLEPILITLRL